MGVVSGIAAAVNGVSTARGWQITYKGDPKAYVASNTKAGPGRLPGNTDWSGSYAAYGHTPPVVPGESFTFLGSVDGATGAGGTALVDSITLTIDIEGGSVIAYSVAFSAADALTLGIAAVVADAEDPDAYSAVGRTVTYVAAGSEAGAWTTLANVRTVTITLTASNMAYVSSTTAGVTKRLAGNFDASIAISIYEGDLSAVIEPHTVYAIRVYVTAALFWDIRWMIFSDASGIDVNREQPNLVSYTANAQFTGWEYISSTWTEGEVLDPATATVWPA
ncbi:MAG TPA: hypothetical protein VNA25_15130 [Phycisphaerae bacterium]|nr:hypothetical protein [Phycisphaerae bacterium]